MSNKSKFKKAEGIYKISSSNPDSNSPKVAILGCVHGNEIIGKDIIENLLEEIGEGEVNGEIILIIANLQAYAENKRFIDIDMNRLVEDNIISQIKQKPAQQRNCEETRLVEIVEHLKDINYLLDIHATVKPTPSPFLYCQNNPKHLELCGYFNAPIIISPESEEITKTMNSCFDNYADSHGGVGITLEAGWLKQENLYNDTKESVYNYLQNIGILNRKIDKPVKYEQKHIMIYKELIAETDNFQFTKDYKNLDFIAKNEVLAKDDNNLISVDRDSYIIFPKKNLSKGSETCYLAYES
jgi:succinylglutamate desuccinylase